MININVIKYNTPVLMYHRVVRKREDAGALDNFITLAQLEQQLNWIHTSGFNTITFHDLKSGNHKGKKNIILTFDDGYKDNYELMFPLLKKLKFTAVVFLVTGVSKNIWDEKLGEPVVELMSKEMIVEMNKYGIEFGGHTRTHAALSEIQTEHLDSEINGSKNDVEKIIGKPVISFAYPYGKFNNQVKEQVQKAGYTYALATKSGSYEFKDDLMEIRRIGIYSSQSFKYFTIKASGYYFTKYLWVHLLSIVRAKYHIQKFKFNSLILK